MSTEEIDVMFKKYGALIDYTKPDNVRIGRINSMLNRNLAKISKDLKNMPEIHVRFVHEARFRIFSDRPYQDKNIYVVVFYEPTFAILDELINRICSSSQILPEWGTTTDEKKTVKFENPHITNFRLLWDQIDEENPVKPVHQTRQDLVTVLLQFVMSNLLYHEVTHIFNGHVDFKLDTDKDISITPENDRITSNVDSLTLQTLEMDADSFGTVISLVELFFANSNIKCIPENIKFIFETISNLVGLWVYAQYFVLRIFGENRPKIEDLKNSIHPPAGIRQRIILNSIMSYIEDRISLTNEELAEFEIYFDYIIKQAEFAFEEISSTKLNRDSIEFAFSEPGSEHFKLLIDNWSNVRPKLEPFTFNENLAPIEPK